MKTLTALLLGSFLAATLATGEPANGGDQKWLETVQKMVTKGEGKVSTPAEGRVKLLQEWGSKNGYSVKVTRTDNGYNLDVSRNLAKK